jgi:VIT1/CCC1 family predicted Fe2+/Mn2+ transporter
MTGRSVLASGARQVAIGGAAAALTYVVGRLIGGAVGV